MPEAVMSPDMSPNPGPKPALGTLATNPFRESGAT
jgi:hypothetical protein